MNQIEPNPGASSPSKLATIGFFILWVIISFVIGIIVFFATIFLFLPLLGDSGSGFGLGGGYFAFYAGLVAAVLTLTTFIAFRIVTKKNGVIVPMVIVIVVTLLILGIALRK